MKYGFSRGPLYCLLVFATLLGCSGTEVSSSSSGFPELSGTLDATLDSDGILTLNSLAGGSGEDLINDIAVDSQNRIVVVGRSSNGTNNDLFVARMSTSGVLDTSFSGDGIFTHDNAAGGSGNDEGTALVIDSTDRIFVVGNSLRAADNDVAIWAIDSSGNLDTSFSGDGILVSTNTVEDVANDVAFDSDGDLIIVGTVASTNGTDMFATKITVTGLLRVDFDPVESDGFLLHDNAAGGTGDDEGLSVFITDTGSIFIAGRSTNGSGNFDLVVWKLTSLGLLDTSFNFTGFAVHSDAAGGTGNENAAGIVVDSSGAVSVCGTSNNGTNDKLTAWRFDSGGQLDTNFNGQGFIVIDLSAGGVGNEVAGDLVRDRSGNIYCLGGSVNGSGNTDMAVWRLTSSGVLDTDFEADGLFAHDNAAGGSGNDQGAAAVFDICEKRLFVGGQSLGANTDAAVWLVQ